jgi:hypothetical protein
MRRFSAPVVAIVIAAVSLAACSTDITTPAPVAVDPTLAIVVTVEEQMLSAVDFEEANTDKVNGICVKDTPSGTVILKDANENTPSEPCPPAFLYKGKPEAIEIRKEWAIEDENRNGTVCVKETGAGRFIVKDDNEATPSEPCPPAFITAGGGKVPGPKVPAPELAQADDNDNAMVCVRVMEQSGNVVVKDDNPNLPSQPCPPSYMLEFVGKKPPKV